MSQPLPNDHSWHPKYVWRQDTPKMQLMAMWAAFEGNYLNMKEGVTSHAKFLEWLERFEPQFNELMGMVRRNQEWSQSFEIKEGP